jgi:hypothetical protein
MDSRVDLGDVFSRHALQSPQIAIALLIRPLNQEVSSGGIFPSLLTDLGAEVL